MYENIREAIKSNEYDFLRTDENLAPAGSTKSMKDGTKVGSQIIMLGLGGSYAYGTNKSDSDIDIRGMALNSKEDSCWYSW